MPCCVNGYHNVNSGNFLLAYLDDSFSEVMGLKLKTAGIPDQNKTEEASEKETSTPRPFQAKIYLTCSLNSLMRESANCLCK